MKSVGEVMAIGRTFQESLQKALRGLETGVTGLDELVGPITTEAERDQMRQELRMPGANRLWYVADAMRHGFSFDDVAKVSQIDPWFLAQIEDLVQVENQIRESTLARLDKPVLSMLKRKGLW